MESKTFIYNSYRPAKEEGEEPIKSKCGVFLNKINSWAEDEGKLYLFLEKEIDDVQPKEMWVEVKKTKDNPGGWGKKIQMRTVKEPVTIKIEDEEDVKRFLDYVNQQSI